MTAKRFIDYLKGHPLVWLVPLTFFTFGLGLVAWKLARTPVNPFIYDL